jgi:Barstar (barnase inhibitor)
MAIFTLPVERIFDWQSFHHESAKLFGFPEFYGQNMNAWIDCLTYLADDDDMNSIPPLSQNENLVLHVPEFQGFSQRVPEICNALLECSASLNQRYIQASEQHRFVLVLE